LSNEVAARYAHLPFELPEGADVTLLELDGEETFRVDEELEAVLLESIAQGERGETISAEALVREMRSRE
jgi:hypothetical protein